MNLPQNPYQPPQSSGDDGYAGGNAALIEQLDVSESWKKRFRLIEKAGGEKMPRFKELTFGERFSINFNILAFLFGFIYLLIKGLWKTALLLLVLTLVIACIEVFFGFNMGNAPYIGLSAGVATLANRLYYKKMVLGRIDWV